MNAATILRPLPAPAPTPGLRGSARIRTGYLRHAETALYRLSYKPMASGTFPSPRGLVSRPALRCGALPAVQADRVALREQESNLRLVECPRPGPAGPCTCHQCVPRNVGGAGVCVAAPHVGRAGVEPTTSGTLGRYSNPLSYRPIADHVVVNEPLQSAGRSPSPYLPGGRLVDPAEADGPRSCTTLPVDGGWRAHPVPAVAVGPLCRGPCNHQS